MSTLSAPFLALVALDDPLAGFFMAARADGGVLAPGVRTDREREALLIGVEFLLVMVGVVLAGVESVAGESLAARRPAAAVGV